MIKPLQRFLISVASLLALGNPAADALGVEQAERAAKVGLVLSGGGARGIAHVGVLQWFEEHRIPVDYVAGTSMGGLVGALYAMGYSPGEITELLHSIDWAQALGSQPPYPALSYRRKEDQRNYQVAFEIGLKHGFSLPTGASSGHYIGLLFDRLTLPYWSVKSFDELPIPFRCMATDFLKAAPLVLKDGSLATALRATMSIPGAFPPVYRDGKVLVDGGLLDNIPADVMKREMSPDAIIAVDIGPRLGDLQSISTLGGILTQTLIVMTIESDRRNLGFADVVIVPELGNIETLDFTAIEPVVKLGYDAADRKAKDLEKFALDERAWNQHLTRRRALIRKQLPVPSSVKVSGVGDPARENVTRRLQKLANRAVDTKALGDTLTRIVGEGRYQSINYGLSASPTMSGSPVLDIRVHDKNYAPPTLRTGIDVDGSDISEIHFSIGGRLTFADIGIFGSEWRNDAKIGFSTLFASEYYLPLGSSGFFAAPRASWERRRINLFSADTRVAEYLEDRGGGGLDLGHTGRLQEFRAGYFLNNLNTHVKTGDPLLPSISGTESYARIRYSFDSSDNPYVPSRGLLIAAEGRWYVAAPLATRQFSQAQILGRSFLPVSKRGSVLVAGSVGTSFDKDVPPAQQFTLGGPFRMPAFDRDYFRGNHFLEWQAGYLHQIARLPQLIGGRVDAIAWWDLGSAFHDFGNMQLRNAAAGGVILETLLGAMSLTGSWGEGGHGKFWFTLGRIF
jgi:NTE family protein